MTMLSFEGKEIETDNDGYLKDSSQWSEALAEVIAEKRVHHPFSRTLGGGAFCAGFLSGIQYLSRHSYAGESHGK